MTTECLTIHDVLSRLNRVKPLGNGWTALCPSHEDKHPSLSINIGDDGKLLLFCHAGCKFSSIMSAIGFHGRGNSLKRDEVFTPPPSSDFVDFGEMLRQFMLDTTSRRLDFLSIALGVTVASLKQIGACWAERYQAWAFPMRRKQHGETVGIRLRNEAGEKWAVRGSHAGLFIPKNIGLSGPVLIGEGPTECAALLDFAVTAIGRPNCTGGTEDLIELLKQIPKERDVIIFANRDQATTLKDGSVLYPGQDGAKSLANRLYRPVKIVMAPKHKDARKWLESGAKPSHLKLLIENTRYHRRTSES